MLYDNVSFHWDDDCLARLRQIPGITLLTLPAYSPEWNPIEQAFKWIKDYLRRHRCKFSGATADEDCVREAMSQLPESKTRGFFRHAGYTFVDEDEEDAEEELLCLLAYLALDDAF